MKHTLAAVFINLQTAQQARSALLAAGFSGSELTLSSRGTSRAWASRVTLAGRVGNFLRSLVEKDAGIYPIDREDVSQGRSVLTVTCETGDRLDEATAIVDRFEPVESAGQAGTGFPNRG